MGQFALIEAGEDKDILVPNLAQGLERINRGLRHTGERHRVL